MYELNKIHNVDCMVGMKTFPDKFFELAIVDVPYGIGEAGQKNKYRGGLATAQDYKPYEGKDREAPGLAYFEELFRISRNQIIFGANHFISRIPYQKPARLYEMIIRRYTSTGDKIIDTHAGSGSCLIAAHRTGHDFIGFEIDPYYCGLAEERLEAEKKLTSLKDRIKQRMRKGEICNADASNNR